MREEVVVTEVVVDDALRNRVLRPRDDIVYEEETAPGRFGLNEGPFHSYEREVETEAVGDGTFIADVDERLNVLVGDEAVLDDPTWPDTSSGLIIGRLTSIEDLEDKPLRKRLVITPDVYAHNVAKLTLKIEEDEFEIAEAGGGEDLP